MEKLNARSAKYVVFVTVVVELFIRAVKMLSISLNVLIVNKTSCIHYKEIHRCTKLTLRDWFTQSILEQSNLNVFSSSECGPALVYIPVRLRSVCSGRLWRPLWLRGRTGNRGQQGRREQAWKGKRIAASIRREATEESPRVEATGREARGSSHFRGVRRSPSDVAGSTCQQQFNLPLSQTVS